MASASNSKEPPLKAVLNEAVGPEIIIPSLKRLAPSRPLRQHPGLGLVRNEFNTWIDLHVFTLKASGFVAQDRIAITGNLR